MANKAPSAVLLQDRDFAVLRGLLESRTMTAAHAAALYFDGSTEAAKKRLQKLKAAGYINERKRRVNEPAILFLTRLSLKTLSDTGHLTDYPLLGLPSLERRAPGSEATIRHELEVMDVKAAFHAAVRGHGAFAIHTFSTWPRMYEFAVSRPGSSDEVPMKPDGFIRIRVQGEFEDTFFLEVDRSTETQDRLMTKALCYREYFFGGGFAVRNSASRDKFKDFPFRVLMVMKSADRRNNTAERLLQCSPPILTQVCLSTLKEVTDDPLGPIWIQPKDYRAALVGTRFDTERRKQAIAYHPQPERNAFVEAGTPKFELLAD